MTPRTMFLLAALLAPGCLGADAPRAPVAEETRPADDASLPWILRECRYVVAWTRVDADALAPHLPPGFEPRRGSPGAILLDGAGGEVRFGFDISVCASGQGVDGDVPDLVYASYWADAAPPDELLVDGVDPSEHYVKFDVLVPDEGRRARLAAYGAPVGAGDARIVGGEGVATRIDATAAIEGGGGFALELVVAGTREAFDGTFVKHQALEGAVVPWIATFAATDVLTGHGTVALEPGSWPASVVGSERAVVRFHTGRWSYDGETRLPPLAVL